MAGLNVSVRDSDGKGRGLFAEVDFDKGEVILTEEPLVSCQFSWNKAYKYEACEYCLRSLETAQESCRRLVQDENLVLPHPECCEVDKLSQTRCELCGAKYCSLRCKDKAVKQYHPVLCLGEQNPIKDDLITLEETWKQIHYPPETSTIMLIAKMIAIVKQSPQSGAFLKNFNNFCRKTENESEKLNHKLLGDKFVDQIESLGLQLKNCLYEEKVKGWFTENGFRLALALLGTNQQGVGSSSLSVWVKNCDKLKLSETQRSKLDQFIDDLYLKLDDVSGEFLNCEGVGLFSLQSACNHSCDPEAEIEFEHGNHTLTLRASRSIPSGGEIHISYLSECDVNRSRHSRQKILSENYLFKCNCQKCVDEEDDPDVTSDEDDDSD